MKYSRYIFFLILFILIIACSNKSDERSRRDLEGNEAVEFSGEVLAKMYCGSCHVFATPILLDKNTWKYGTLPQMGFRMGIYHEISRQSLIESNPGGVLVEQRNIFPVKPILDVKHYELINEYYIQEAPETLTIPEKELHMGLRGLQVDIPEFHVSPPMVTAIKYHPELNQVLVADAKTDYSTINILDSNLESVSTLAVPSPISHIDCRSDTIWATLMGGFMPTDNPNGSIINIFKLPGANEYTGFTSVLKNLQRPVHTTYIDINDDHLEDIIVCEYGNHTGKLSLFINKGEGQYERKILSYDPGSIHVEIRDMNKDGLPDIVALMAQGNERIDVYYNNGNGDFSIVNLLRFPPSFGSSSFSLVDWNGDGYDDIVYVNGDNADYSMVLKPYHGLRIFLNDGENRFHEAFFQHINGAYKSMIYDFDRDGDLDIAISSFFPDLMHSPEEGFVFMKNVQTSDSIQFDLYSFDQATLGRWITMEAVDLDQNGFPELVLGSFTGMPINGDVDGKIGENYVRNSPTLMYLNFDEISIERQ